MRTWSMIGGVVAILGLSACGDAAAKSPAKRPPELLVTVSLGPEAAFDRLRDFASSVQPGAGALLTPELVRRKLGELSTALSLDGVDPTAPTYLLVVDGGAQLQGAAVVFKVRDEKAVTDGLGEAQSVIQHGWAVVGPKAVVLKVAPYALATLPSRPAAASPTAEIYLPLVLKRYRAEIDAGIKQMGAQMAAAQSSAQTTAMMQSYIDGLYSTVTDSEKLQITLDATNDLGAIDLALIPRNGSRLAKFVAAQRPSDYALLSRLPASPAPMLIAGHIDSGPYRKGMLAMFASMYSQGDGTREMIAAMGEIMRASTGDIAMSMQMGPGKPMTFTQLFGLADRKATDKSIAYLLDLFKTGRTFDSMGIGTTIKSNPTPMVHNGVSLAGFDVTYDLSKAPAATRELMEKMIPSGPKTTRITTLDRVGVVTFGGDDPTPVLDAALGKGTQFTPSAQIAAFLAASVARKESLLIVVDVGAFTGAQGPARSIMMSAGFADKAAHLRITLPAQTVRALVDQP